MPDVLRLLRTPRWLAFVVAALAAAAVCVWLGQWQLERYRGDARTVTAAPVPLEQLAEPARPLGAEVLDRPVTATGRYDPGAQVLLPGRGYDGRAGFVVVTALVTDEGTVPVARGWVPTADDPATSAPSGERTVRGVLRGPEEDSASGLPPGQEPGPGQVAVVTPESMAGVLDGPAYQGFVQLVGEFPAAEPAPAPMPVDGVSSQPGGRALNLGYALQWWVFAAFVVFLAVRVLRNAREEEEHRAAPREGSVRAGSP